MTAWPEIMSAQFHWVITSRTTDYAICLQNL